MRHFIVAIVFLMSLPILAQGSYKGLAIDTIEVTPRKFEQSAIEAYKVQDTFDYREIVVNQDVDPTWFDRILNWLNRNLLKILEWIFGLEQATGILSVILQILPYAIGVLVLYLLIKFFIDRNTTDIISTAKNKQFYSRAEDEDLLRNSDLNALLGEAISNGQYRNAVRFYYLLALKNLDLAQIILWEQQKTNEDFIKEISADELKLAFRENTRLYDFVWYGEFGLTKDEFLKAETDFKRTMNLIKTRIA